MKVLFLALVYSAPFLAGLLPYDWFQGIWLWLYLPFAIIAVAFVAYRPNKEMMLWVCLSPFVFWLFVNLAALIYGINESGLEGAFQPFFLSLVLSTPIGFMVGAYSLLCAFGLYAIFRQQSWLK